jgi:hypothetical protein
MLICALAIKDTWIMDVTAGTMSTSVACMDLGYKWFASDPDDELLHRCLEERIIPMVGCLVLFT